DATARLRRAALRPATPAGERAAAGDLQAALRCGGDPVAILRVRADRARRAGSEPQAAAAERAAAAFAAGRMVAPGEAARVRAEIWRAFHAGERAWTFALIDHVAVAWPTQMSGDLHYLWALLVTEGPREPLEAAAQHAAAAAEAGFAPFWSWRLVGWIAQLRGDAAAAEAAFERAETAAESDENRRLLSEHLCELAWSAFRTGDAATVARQAAKARRLTGDGSAAALYLQAEAERMLGELGPEVAALYDAAEALGYDATWCELRRGEVLLAGLDPPAGWRRLCALVRRARGDVRAAALGLLRRAMWRAYEAGELPQSAAALNELLTLDPGSAEINYLLGESELLQRRPAAALEAYGRALAAGYDAYWAHRRMGEALAARREPGEAIGEAERTARLAAAAAARTPRERHEVLRPVRLAWAAERAALSAPSDAQEAIAGLAGAAEEVVLLLEEGHTGAALGVLLAKGPEPAFDLAGLALFRARLLLAPPEAGDLTAGQVLALARVCAAARGLARTGGEAMLDAVLRTVAASPGLQARLQATLGARRDAGARLLRFELARLNGASVAELEALAAAAGGAVDPRRLARALRREAGAGSADETLLAEALLDASADEAERLAPRARELAWSRFHAGAPAAARKLAEAVLVRRPDDPAMLYLAAEALQVEGQELARAEALYGAALAQGFDPYWARFNRAQARAKLGRTAEAIEDLQAAAAQASDAEAVTRVRESLGRLGVPA
ncbi:hypothetical protein, partial [Phenylobacterium sp.]|uniref:hypothetical protein n=1 Tax=Phenylobacterium sp. TaxID=1871053 RepID=UPI0035AF741C